LSGTAARLFNLTYRFFTSAGAGIGVQVSTSSIAFTGALQTASVTGITVPATAAFLGIYPIRVTGTEDIDIYSTTVVHGSDLPGVVRPSPVAPAVWDEFLAARGTEATIDDRFVSLETGAVVSFPANQDVYGRFYLRDWSAQIAKIQQAGSGEQADIALIGDSWVQNDLIGSPSRTALQTLYGAGGAGYIGIGNDHGEPTLTGTSYNRTGTWTDRDNFPAPVGYGIDIADATTTDLTATVVITSITTDFTIHYIKQVNGGSFRHKIDAGGWTTVNTANASTIHATEAITGLSNASHTLTIEITVAGVAGVTMLGVDARITGTNAVRLHRIGNGGATIAQYVSADATIWQAALTAIAPNLAIVLLGTNDDSANIVPATFATNLTTLVTRIRTAMPLCDVLLLTPTANGLTPGTYGMSDYVAQIRSVAVANDCMCLDMYMSIDDYTDGDARGLFADTAHLNAYGGQIVANRLVRELVVD
jgi:lysophospholipase L1-like esterase